MFLYLFCLILIIIINTNLVLLRLYDKSLICYLFLRIIYFFHFKNFIKLKIIFHRKTFVTRNCLFKQHRAVTRNCKSSLSISQVPEALHHYCLWLLRKYYLDLFIYLLSCFTQSKPDK